MGNNSLGKTIKAHGSSEQAFKCYEQYLLRNGYKKIGSREFQPIAGGPVMVLTKKSHFGGRLRKGKSGEKAVSSGNRFVPISKGKHNPAGIIV
jgi:hypothetical protein